tara:strand:- start:947 stop:1492 length:546 start_codon:yes stop_codon:yes gene_type:complete
MANQRLTDKSALALNPSSDDLFHIVDVSDTTGSAAGTSKKIENKFIIQTDKVAISSANFQAMDTGGGAGTFQTLVAAPGSGFMIQPLTISVAVDYTSGTQSSKKVLFFGHQTADSNYTSGYIFNFMHSITTDTFYITSPVNLRSLQTVSSADNLPLYVFSSGNFSSTFSADIYVTYQVVKI